MSLTGEDFRAIRGAIAAIPPDASNDAVGANAARLEEIYAPETHAAALDPATPIVLGSRGSGKSFWASVLFQLRHPGSGSAGLSQARVGPDRRRLRLHGYRRSRWRVRGCHRRSRYPRSGATTTPRRFGGPPSSAQRIAPPATATARPSAFLAIARDYEAREDQLLAHEARLRARVRACWWSTTRWIPSRGPGPGGAC